MKIEKYKHLYFNSHEYDYNIFTFNHAKLTHRKMRECFLTMVEHEWVLIAHRLKPLLVKTLVLNLKKDNLKSHRASFIIKKVNEFIQKCGQSWITLDFNARPNDHTPINRFYSISILLQTIMQNYPEHIFPSADNMLSMFSDHLEQRSNYRKMRQEVQQIENWRYQEESQMRKFEKFQKEKMRNKELEKQKEQENKNWFEKLAENFWS